MRKRKNIVFELDGEKCITHELRQYSWNDLYAVLRYVRPSVSNEAGVFIDACLSSGKGITEKMLWTIFEHITQDVDIPPDLKIIAGWVMACYGYYNSHISTRLDEYRPWPKPVMRGKTRPPRFDSWQDKLFCPVCLKPYSPPKNYKNKEAILKHFGVWMKKHMQHDHH